MDRIVIYHNRDFDGLISAALFKFKFPDTKFIGWDYTSMEKEFELINDIRIE